MPQAPVRENASAAPPVPAVAVDLAKPGSYLTLRNAKIDMFRGSMRLAVNQVGAARLTGVFRGLFTRWHALFLL